MTAYMLLNATRSHDTDDFSGHVPLVGTSGGINSAALLCYLATEHPPELRPSRLLLYYAHLREHTPDTFRFVVACVRYARQKFPQVEFGMSRASVLEFFEDKGIIPHPTISPCTVHLKIKPMEAWAAERGATIDLIGYVKSERNRIKRQQEKGVEGKRYPIAHMSDGDCFRIVDREIGWHPAVYDIKENGRRVFTHNNCMPCKNMELHQIESVRRYYPEKMAKADALAERLGAYWGRKEKACVDPCENCLFD